MEHSIQVVGMTESQFRGWGFEPILIMPGSIFEE